MKRVKKTKEVRLPAFGMYVSVLRERQGCSRKEFAKQVGSTDMTIGRIEDGQQEPKGRFLARIVMGLKADWADVQRFLLNPAIPADEGREAANRQYSRITAGTVDDDPVTEVEFEAALAAQDEPLRRAGEAALTLLRSLMPPSRKRDGG